MSTGTLTLLRRCDYAQAVQGPRKSLKVSGRTAGLPVAAILCPCSTACPPARRSLAPAAQLRSGEPALLNSRSREVRPSRDCQGLQIRPWQREQAHRDCAAEPRRHGSEVRDLTVRTGQPGELLGARPAKEGAAIIVDALSRAGSRPPLWQRRLYPNVTNGEYRDKPGKSPRTPPFDKGDHRPLPGLKAQHYCAELDV
jgi:hypothetical protein